MAFMKPRKRQDGGTSHVVCWTDAGGKAQQTTYRDKAEANRALKERIAQEVRDELLDTAKARQPFEDVSRAWLAATRRKVKGRTADGYESLLRTHALPEFGDRRIGSITSQEIEEWLGELDDRGLTIKTIRNAYTPVYATFRYAVRHKILRVNPCLAVEVPDNPDEAEFEGHPLTRPQVAALATDLDRWPPYGLAARFLAGTGLRAAEFAGLRLGDLDLQAGGLRVARTLSRDRNTREWTVGTTKSKRRREVPILDDVLLADLAEYVETHPRGRESGAPLFYGRATGGHGPDPDKPFDPHVFYQWHLKPAARRLYVPELRVHDLRHTAATLWWEDGVPLEVISLWLGHASVEVTARVYVNFRLANDHSYWREQYGTGRNATQERSVVAFRRKA